MFTHNHRNKLRSYSTWLSSKSSSSSPTGGLYGNNIQGKEGYSINYATSTGTFEPDEVITQATTGASGRVVEWDSDLSLLYYQQESFKGYGTNATTGGKASFSGANLITGGTSSANGTPSTETESVTLASGSTLTLTTGYANPELQPYTGNIIYLENRKPIQRASDQTEDIKIIIEF